MSEPMNDGLSQITTSPSLQRTFVERSMTCCAPLVTKIESKLRPMLYFDFILSLISPTSSG